MLRNEAEETSPMLNYRTVTALGLLVAVIIHYGLTATLRFAPGKDEKHSARKEPVVTTITGRDNLQIWEPELIAWAEVVDPTLISLPHTTLGFSSVRLGKTHRLKVSIPAYKPRIDEVDYKLTPALELQLSGFNFSDLSTPPLQRPKLPVKAPTPKPVPQRVIWRTGQGQTIPHMLRRLPDDIQKQVKPEALTGPTVIEIQKMRDFVRLRLLQSSGSRLLDRFATRLIGKKTAVAEAGKNSPEEIAANPFIPAPDKTQTIEVEWRLAIKAPSPKEADDDQTDQTDETDEKTE